MEEYKTTTLWKTAFGRTDGLSSQQLNARADLLTALRTIEDRVIPLLASIPESCKGLTIHDISHVHQLWSVASEICGPNYPVNPLEGFVLGAAFLIHDAGLTAAAYPGGLKALKEIDYYRDRVATLLRSENEDFVPSLDAIRDAPASVADRALFETLRAVHAKRAETLLETAKSHPLTGQPYGFFPDPDLYLDCGEIIGLVAASHHWPLDKVDHSFGDPRTAPAKFPCWSIDIVKLACILRAADACAIDERRARVMPFLLADPRDVSRDHWFFQMNMNPGQRRGDAIVFHSKQPFSRAQMPAWWVAFDAIKIADQELRTCDHLLRSRSSSGAHPELMTFAATRVDGASEPNRLKKLVRVNDWTPVDTSVRVDNPLSLVQKLGGHQLYGNDVSAPLRELIQNAADAVRARRNRAARLETPFSGQIDISVEVTQADDKITSCVLAVSDNGVGMPQDVLTGALLDFGRTFWSTEDAAVRYPGLASDRRFKPTGRFGVGFYAIFMIAEDVKVISRAWDDGLSTLKTLHFRRGIRGRAELRDYSVEEDGNFNPQHSTTILAKLNKLGWPGRFGWSSARANEHEIRGVEHFWKLFERTTQQLVFALDVECQLTVNGSSKKKVNSPTTLSASPAEFARAFNAAFSNDAPGANFDEEEVARIASIEDEDGAAHSRGVINSSGNSSGIIHIGGLTVFGSVEKAIKGIVAYAPGTASRTVGRRIAQSDRLRRWGEKQLEAVTNADLSLETKLASIANLVNINIDITRHAMLSKDGILCDIATIVRSLSSRESIFVGLQPHHAPWPHSLSNPISHNYKLTDLKELKHSIRLGSPNYGTSDEYNRILGPLDNPTNSNSAYAVLINELRNANYQLTIEGPAHVVLGIYNGPKGGRGRFLDRELIKGTIVRGYGIQISCEKIGIGA